MNVYDQKMSHMQITDIHMAPRARYREHTHSYKIKDAIKIMQQALFSLPIRKDTLIYITKQQQTQTSTRNGSNNTT